MSKDESRAKDIILNIPFFIAGLLLGWGWDAMNTGNNIAPYLFAVGIALIIFAILYICNCIEWLGRHIHNKRFVQVIFVGICLIIATLSWFGINYEVNYKVNQENERLANTPTFSCTIEPESDSSSSNTANLTLGGVSIKITPQQNYILCVNSVPFLSLGTNKDGYLLLSTTVEDSKNKNVVAITNNHVLGYQKDVFRPIQPDEHTFVMRDSEDNKILYVDFIDPKTIYLTGIFYMKGYSEPVTITDKNMTYPGGGITTACSIDLTDWSGNYLDFSGNNTVTLGVI